MTLAVTTRMMIVTARIPYISRGTNAYIDLPGTCFRIEWAIDRSWPNRESDGRIPSFSLGKQFQLIYVITDETS